MIEGSEMRAQSALEFLSTYGFLFTILAVVIVIVAFIAGSATSAIPGQCSSFAGPSCNFVMAYSNQNPIKR